MVNLVLDNILTLDSKEYHPEDKNFDYYRSIIGNNLVGFLGSPNLKHNDSVYTVAFSPDDKIVASGSNDNTIKLWDVGTGKKMGTFMGHSNAINSVVFSHDNKFIISSAWDMTLKLWHIETGKCIETIDLPWIPFEIKAFPGKPGHFATANGNGTVTFFDFGSLLKV